MKVLTAPMLVLLEVACATSRPMASSAAPLAIALPGAPDGGVAMDYIAYDSAHSRVWVPAGNTGSVDVIDTATHTVTRLDGFATAQVQRSGKTRIVGPSSAAVGDGVVFVGNRGDSSVCAFDAVTLKRGACVTLDSMPDGLAWVSSTRELWVTTPRDQSIRVLDASSGLSAAAKIEFEGEPEGFAVDAARGVFFTNLEDKDLTLAVDLETRKVRSTWKPGCGDDGPKGLAFDGALDFLAVACADHVVLLDAGHDGKQLSRLDAGDGVDNLDYVTARHELYVAAGKAATLTVARLESSGQLIPLATVKTAMGARNAIATENGVAYLTDGPGGAVLVIEPGSTRSQR